MSIVATKNLAKTYDIGGERVYALRELDLDVLSGEYLAIMGPSGSGKSTLLNLLGCLDQPTGGHYWLGGQDVSILTDAQLSHVRNTKIGFIFQSFNLVPQLSVLENIEVPLFYQGMPRKDRRRRSTELAHRVGLAQRMGHRPRQLSGGQQQRVAIARAMANEPLLLLADEPTGNLDSHTTSEILSLFAELHAQGRTIIMITHEEDVAARSKRIIRMRDGMVESDLVHQPTIHAGCKR